MIARITRIQDGKIWAKVVNPLLKPDRKLSRQIDGTYNNEDCSDDLGRYAEAESQLKELELHLDSYSDYIMSRPDGLGDQDPVWCLVILKFEIGDEINVIEIENKFKII